MGGTREVFVEGKVEEFIDGSDLNGDVTITEGKIKGDFTVTIEVSDTLEWEYNNSDITDMLDYEQGELDFLWTWLEGNGVEIWAQFLNYLIKNLALDMEDTLILKDIILKHQRDLILKEKEEKDAAKV